VSSHSFRHVHTIQIGEEAVLSSESDWQAAAASDVQDSAFQARFGQQSSGEHMLEVAASHIHFGKRPPRRLDFRSDLKLHVLLC
jgi:hypothetical protein